MKIFTISYSSNGTRLVVTTDVDIPSGFVWSTSTPPMPDHEAAERWADARERLGQEPKAEPEPSNLLDDPRMDGEVWIQASDITSEMRSAWPLWEENTAGHIHVWRSQDITLDGACVATWRPLRMPGMNDRCEILWSDMTPEHFDRYRSSWQWRMGGGPWRTLDGSSSQSVVRHGAVEDGEVWRPAILADSEPKSAEPQAEPEFAELYDLLGVDSPAAALQAVKDLKRDKAELCEAIAPGSFRGDVSDHVARVYELRRGLACLADKHILSGHDDYEKAHRLARGDKRL